MFREPLRAHRAEFGHVDTAPVRCEEENAQYAHSQE
jgi:hypothetical protein